MNTSSARDNRKTSPNTVPGPNLCSQVGANVSTLLRAALMEMCDQRHGQISYADIDHVFDLVISSSELFSVYQRGYSNCVALKNSAQFVRIDEDTVTQFVVGAYCRDVITDVFRDHAIAKSTYWRRAFVLGFANFLADTIEPGVRGLLFGAYQKLVTKYAASLTPVTILNAEEVVTVFSRTVFTMKVTMRDDPSAAARLQACVNETIAATPASISPACRRISETECQAFVERLFAPPTTNPFRRLILNAEREVLSDA